MFQGHFKDFQNRKVVCTLKILIYLNIFILPRKKRTANFGSPKKESLKNYLLHNLSHPCTHSSHTQILSIKITSILLEISESPILSLLPISRSTSSLGRSESIHTTYDYSWLQSLIASVDANNRDNAELPTTYIKLLMLQRSIK